MPPVRNRRDLRAKHRVELFAQRVEVEDVRRRVGDLGVAQGVGPNPTIAVAWRSRSPRAPEPGPSGRGGRYRCARFRGDFCAIDRRRHDAKSVAQRRPCRSGHNGTALIRWGRQTALQVWRVRLAGHDLHDVGAAVAARKLDDAERSRRTSRPRVSVSIATAGPRSRFSGRSPLCKRIVIFARGIRRALTSSSERTCAEARIGRISRPREIELCPC